MDTQTPSPPSAPNEDFFRALEVERTRALVDRDVEKIRLMHAPDYEVGPAKSIFSAHRPN